MKEYQRYHLLQAYAEPSEAPGSTATFCRIDAAASRKERTRKKMTLAMAQNQGSGRETEGRARQDTIGQGRLAARRLGGCVVMQTDRTKQRWLARRRDGESW